VNWDPMPTPQEVENSIGFVYRLTLPDGRKYIGQKKFHSTTKTKLACRRAGKVVEKGKKKTVRRRKESDWRNYYSSSEEIKRWIEEHGKEGIRREILQIVPAGRDGAGAGLLSYYELVWQLKEEAHLRSDYLNGIINVRLSRNCFPAWIREEADKRANVASDDR